MELRNYLLHPQAKASGFRKSYFEREYHTIYRVDESEKQTFPLAEYHGL